MKQPRSKSRASRIALTVAVDFLVFAVLLLTFAYFHHVRVDPLEPSTLPILDTPVLTPEADATPAPTAEPGVLTPEPTSEPTPAPTDLLRGQYAEKFTDGAVENGAEGYRSANVAVDMRDVQIGDVTYYVADIYVKDITSFRTAVAREFGKANRMQAVTMAQMSNAVVAMSGDFFEFRKTDLVAIRNGQVWVDDKPYEYDICVLYRDGVMETVAAKKIDMEAVYARNPYHVWSFGPLLLDDNSKAIPTFNSTVKKRNPRCAVGYYEPGHYCFVTVDGRQDGYSLGMSLTELSQLFEDLGCVSAYNLDGGDTIAMVYAGGLRNHPQDDEPRDVSDILFIAEPLPETQP